MKMNFEKEIKSLDEVYTEMVDAILNRPDSEDFEASRVYFGNVSARLNKWVDNIKDVKTLLENKEPAQDLTADNRPA